ncbi:MAG: hypothetical protein WBZ04_03895 [Candidatus Nanopelagicales bacterium]
MTIHEVDMETFEPAEAVAGAWRLLEEWINRFTNGREQFETSQVALGELHAETQLRHAEASVLSRYRPWNRIGDVLSEVLADLQRCIDMFVRAYSADTISEAQTLGARIESTLTKHKGVLDALSTVSDDLHELTNVADVNSLLLSAGASSARTVEGNTLLALEDRGAEVWAEIAGEPLECPVGIGLMLALSTQVASVTGNVPEFVRVAKLTYSYLCEQKASSVALMSHEPWRQHFRSSIASMHDLQQSVLVSLARTESSQQAVSDQLRFAAKVLERGTRPHCLLLDAAATGKTTPEKYVSMRWTDGGVLIKRIRSRTESSEIVRGLSDELRNADSHENFTIAGQVVRMYDKHGVVRRQLNQIELGDSVAAVGETAMALTVGILAAACALGVYGDDLLPTPDELTSIDGFALHVTLAGLTNVELEVDGNAIRVRTASALSSAITQAVISGEFAVASGIETIAVESAVDGAIMTVFLGYVRTWNEASGFDRDLAFLCLLESVECPAYMKHTREELAGAIAHYANEACTLDLRERQTRLFKLTRFAAELGFDELVEQLKAVRGAERNKVLDLTSHGQPLLTSVSYARQSTSADRAGLEVEGSPLGVSL